MKQPFNIDIDQSILNDLKVRLSQTRWPDEIANDDWQYGTNLSYLQSLCTYWETEFDWRQQEVQLNTFDHFKTTVDGLSIHFIYEKGKGPNAVPLLLTHGFPDSFIRFLKVIPLLTEPDERGVCFDVVVPSIPGYGFSDKPTEPGMNPTKVASIFHTLMTEELGYKQFFAQGGDWGSSITEQLAYKFPSSLFGIHLTDIPYHHLFTVAAQDLTQPEKEYLEKGKQWQMTEGGYAILQSTKPQSLAYGLNDSPVGLAAWIIEKFYRWSDNNGNLEQCFTKDELLTNLTIYWATQTINSTIRIYFESMHLPPDNADKKVEVPTGVATFPKDLIPAPKEFADRFYNVQHWSEMYKGGHFAAMEQPELLVQDIKKFVTQQIQ